jgi:hypothetical protein
MCFSLAWIEELLVWLVVVCAIVAILKILLPFVAAQLGAAGGDMKAFLLERKEALESCDLDKFIALHQKYNPGVAPMSREVVEIAMHKARTADRQLSMAERGLSKRWLTEKGYGSWDGGEVEMAPKCS